uniref:Uncharacterized protein n=1 Tax=Rhizophora mucronata TaxID=61149 RepID=A0A2P2PMP4_RHIMU
MYFHNLFLPVQIENQISIHPKRVAS